MHKIYIRYWILMLFCLFVYGIFIFVYGNFRVVFEEFRVQYYLLETATGFLRYMLLFHTLVLFVYWHWNRESPASSMYVVSHVFLLCLPVIVLYTVVVLFLNPSMELAKDRYQSTTDYLVDLVSDAKEAIAKGENRRSVDLLQRYMGLTKRDEPIESLFLEAQLQEARQNRRQLPPEETSEFSMRLREQNAAKLYSIAEDYFARDDYVSSFYYAGAAAVLSEPPREDALQLQQDTRKLIQDGFLLQEENAARRLFFRKAEAIQTLIAGETDAEQSLYAYRLLRELKKDYPDDREITLRQQESLEQIRTRTFFLDQAILEENRPGFYNTWFIDEHEGQYHVFFAKHVSYSSDVSYAFDVEILQIDKNSFQPRLHLRADLAQIIDNIVNFLGIDEDGTRQSIQLLSGSSTPYVFTFNQSVIDVISRGRIQQNWKTVGLLDFFHVLRVSSPRIQERMLSYLIAQGVIVFLFVITAFWVKVIVSKHSQTPSKREWYAWLCVPLMLWVTILVQDILLLAVDVVSIALFRMLGMIGTISVTTALILILLIAGMIRVQKNVPEEA